MGILSNYISIFQEFNGNVDITMMLLYRLTVLCIMQKLWRECVTEKLTALLRRLFLMLNMK